MDVVYPLHVQRRYQPGQPGWPATAPAAHRRKELMRCGHLVSALRRRKLSIGGNALCAATIVRRLPMPTYLRMARRAGLWVTAICVSVLTTSQCRALDTGNDIREPCRAALLRPVPVASLVKAEFCNGFVQAILNIRPRLESQSKFCPPSETTTEQAARVMLKFLDDHPEETHLRPEFVAVRAFQTTWPCR
jgi:hypothetical protein